MTEPLYVSQSRQASQETMKIYMDQLEALLKTIWWCPVPAVLTHASTVGSPKFEETWASLSPTYLLSSIIPVLYGEDIPVAEVRQVIETTEGCIVDGWNRLIDVLRWTPKHMEGRPVIWKFPELVTMALAFADAMTEYHQYIYASMQDDMDDVTREGFFDLLIDLNKWVGAFKRIWRGAAWVDQSMEELKPLVRADVRVQLDRLPRR